MELRDEIAAILGKHYMFGPDAYPSLAEPVVDEILAIPRLQAALQLMPIGEIHLGHKAGQMEVENAHITNARVTVAPDEVQDRG